MRTKFKTIIAFTIFSVISFAQNTTILNIKDTRDVNDLPNAKKQSIEADFKYRHVLDVPGNGVFSANITISPWADDSGGKNYQLNFNEGGIFYRKALPSNLQWEQWQKLILTNSQGRVGIGTDNPDEILTVNGNIHAKEIKVDLDVPADYVFQKYYTGNSILKPSYNFKTLEEVEYFIKKNHHLPEIPSSIEIKDNGLKVGEMNNLLLQKIEELTIYLIEQNKVNKKLEDRIRELEKSKN